LGKQWILNLRVLRASGGGAIWLAGQFSTAQFFGFFGGLPKKNQKNFFFLPQALLKEKFHLKPAALPKTRAGCGS
jgi:hypothetical protein